MTRLESIQHKLEVITQATKGQSMVPLTVSEVQNFLNLFQEYYNHLWDQNNDFSEIAKSDITKFFLTDLYEDR